MVTFSQNGICHAADNPNVDGQYKYFFEELDFIVGLDFDVSGKITITLPIGLNVIITAGLNGNITGIFQLKTDYTGDS